VKHSGSPGTVQRADPTQVAWDAVAPVWREVPTRKHEALVECVSELREGWRRRACQHSDSGMPLVGPPRTPGSLSGLTQRGWVRVLSKTSRVAAAVLSTAAGVAVVVFATLAARDLVVWLMDLLADVASIFTG
jgi:hypothetical protein